MRIDPNLTIAPKEFLVTFIRASGPGGQHVNKSSTAVQVRFNARNSPSLPPDVRQRLVRIAGNRMNSAGEIVVTAQRFRSREQNRRDAMERIYSLVSRAAIVPKKRRKTRPSAAARKRRLDDKRKRSAQKKLRGRPEPRG
ncbi:MAG: aminoacyl-tRNA hydrolase [Gammaproteobacteria bacterium]|nr:aminoacyl-tRNA hydrolase [Gammaproteobacteria bacterium]